MNGISKGQSITNNEKGTELAIHGVTVCKESVGIK